MMNAKMRKAALVNVLVYATIFIVFTLCFDWARDEKVDVSFFLYALVWLVVFVNAFSRERRQALRGGEE